MRKLIALIWLVTICSVAAQTQRIELTRIVSPKLRQFLAGNLWANQIMTEALSVSCSNRPVQIHYFYTDDETRSRGGLYYEGESQVTFLIRENQEPCDEYLSLLYGTLLLQSSKGVKDLMERAKTGDIAKVDFVSEARKNEFQVVLKMRDLLKRLKLTSREQDSSFYYKSIADCPDVFVDYLLYKPKEAVIPQSDSYGNLYDSLRKGP